MQLHIGTTPRGQRGNRAEEATDWSDATAHCHKDKRLFGAQRCWQGKGTTRRQDVENHADLHMIIQIIRDDTAWDTLEGDLQGGVWMTVATE